MYNFPDLLKKIRDESGLTQEEFAKALNVSTVLISMVETGQKKVSKNFILKIADRLGVHPSSIVPFLFADETNGQQKISSLEKSIVSLGEKLQDYLIRVKSKKLKQYV